MINNSVADRLSALREAMTTQHIDAYIVTNYDPHTSEYSADHWLARQWISGFTGSAGTAVVTHNGGGLWTDGRYYIQAEEQLQGSGLNLFKAKLAETPSIPQWLASTLPKQARVGVDGRSINQEFYLELQAAFSEKGIEIVLEHDLISPIWHNRPARPNAKVFNHDLKYAGISTSEKVQTLREYLNEQQAQAILVSTLDDVMWTLNIRGGDTDYSPVSEAYLFVSQDNCRLFIDNAKLDSIVADKLLKHGVSLHQYEHVTAALNLLENDSKVIYNAKSTDSLLINSIKAEISLIALPCVVTQLKAIKNSTELTNMKETLRCDGVAMVKFMYWLEQQVPSGQVSELSAEACLMGFRQQQPGYISDSFRTIAGFGEHGAKMHYAASENSNVSINESEFFLVDSGGQFLGGTTDITRTFHFGNPSDKERRDYTLVLKAVIRLTQSHFLKGATGANLDIMARGVLWQYGIDYKCGTGHGVGMCLNVHEGPLNFSQNPAEVALQPGMVITNEPGVYREGEYGIRIENIMQVVEIEENEFGTFYGFETITLAPIATNMLNVDMLSSEEIDWLNDYHQQCMNFLAADLSEDERAWLKQATQPITQ
ncbi:aminopeptidase P family protein [Vibrio sp. T187]|uniref:aminopeptidase P family protein n=1 Tax=Vibrio TaxID=662 RepID=UPI0010C9CF73|nr:MULTISPECIES: aminopeptidase P family protein [Vibrio]MBW3694995.1 aminopeptidase P family protein [Vibrio sp. T187]